MSRIKPEDIAANISEFHWKLISTTYTNLDGELEFECPEGHRVFSSWKKMRAKLECPTCKANELSKVDAEIKAKPRGTYRVIALDQASHITGYSIFDDGKLVKYGTFRTELSDEIARCSAIKSWLLSIITSWKPDYIGFEGIQFQEEGGGRSMGVTVFQTLARLQGILMETCYTTKVPYTVCPTNTWRHACGVKGRTRADKKRSMQLLVKQWYDISVSDDESDAIGIGRYLISTINKNTVTEDWET